MSTFSRSQKAISEEETLLQKLGLSRQEALIYITLLSEPESLTVGELSRLSALHRPTVYRTVPNLIDKGLITKELHSKRTRYRAESPRKLRPVFDQLREEIEASLPQLEKTFDHKQEHPSVKMLEGKRAVSFMLFDVLHTLSQGETYYRYSSADPSVYGSTGHLPRNYKKLRDLKQIKRLVITTSAVAKVQEPTSAREVKIFPVNYGVIDHNVSQFIYGNKVAFVDYTNEIVLMIQHDKIAKFQAQIFKMLFDRLN
ncbi:MAG: helix-turn-helix domain-containing protein [Candidatus Vogelbacteria bacterium]|nr:helix-turn-helix domain-containing protein [Candidatus Vogelbacteria bacterium]